MKNIEADNHFKAAEQHIAEGRHKEAWKEIGLAQQKATVHARGISDGGGNPLAYRKITMGRVGVLASKMRDTPEPIKKALELSEMQIAKATALSFVWELMKKEGPGKYKYIIPQIELARTPEDIKTIFALYGFQPLRKSDSMKDEEYPLVVGGYAIVKKPTPDEMEKRWERILSASKDIEKKLGVKKKQANR